MTLLLIGLGAVALIALFVGAFLRSTARERREELIERFREEDERFRSYGEYLALRIRKPVKRMLDEVEQLLKMRPFERRLDKADRYLGDIAEFVDSVEPALEEIHNQRETSHAPGEDPQETRERIKRTDEALDEAFSV